MLKLIDSLHAWGSEAFAQTLKRELCALPSGNLPLHDGVSQGGMVDDRNMDITLLRSAEHGQYIEVVVGVFFIEIVGGCSCGDDPMEGNAYCELQVLIDKSSAEAQFRVLK